MSIGFDLDRIFIDHPPLVPATFIDKFYKKRTEPELFYRIPSSPERMLRRLTHYPLFRRAIYDNIDVTRHIAKTKDYQQFLVSSRYGFLKKATENLIKRHGFDKIFDGMYFNFDNLQPHVFKDMMIKKLNLDKYVDDDLDLLKYLAKKNPQTLFYWLNHDFNTTIEKNLIAISNLKKIL